MSTTHVTIPGGIADTGEANKLGKAKWDADHVITDLVAAVGSTAVDRPILLGTETWNAAGVTFTAVKINVTNIASAIGSKLLDLQVDGVSKMLLTKAGAMLLAAMPAYDTAADSLGYGVAVGSAWGGSTIPVNVPIAKSYFPMVMDLENTGQGKMFGMVIRLKASHAAQDPESIRGLVVQLTNIGGAGSAEKTTGGRFDVSATNAAFDGLLWGLSAGVNATINTGNAGGLFSSAIVVANIGADDKASGIILGPSDPVIQAIPARQVIGFGNLQPVPYLLSAFRAFMATTSAANARAFQVMDPTGVEVGWISRIGTGVLAGIQLINSAGARTAMILNGNSNSTYTGFQAPATAPNMIYTMPTTVGTAGQRLTTDGAGNLSWAA